MSDTMEPHPEGKLLMTTAPIFAQGDPWTIDDLERLPDDVHLQILDGSLLVSPSPTSLHQRAAHQLADQLLERMPAELDVQLAPGVQVKVSYLEPDVAVVRTAVADRNVKRFQADDVLLVVEVISPSNAGLDRREKPVRYAEAGIPHFWRVEIEGDRSPYVVRYGLVGGEYVELGTVWAGEEQAVDVSFPVTLRPAELTRRRRG